jgi:hypothetical protein
VCSKPHSDYKLFVSVIGLLGLIGIFAFRFSFGVSTNSEPTDKKSEEKPKKKSKKRKIY